MSPRPGNIPLSSWSPNPTKITLTPPTTVLSDSPPPSAKLSKKSLPPVSAISSIPTFSPTSLASSLGGQLVTLSIGFPITSSLVSGRVRKRSLRCLLTSRAFDSVWHDALIYKLHRLQIPPVLLSWIDGFITGRQASVKINSATSHAIYPKAGVPQESVL